MTRNCGPRTSFNLHLRCCPIWTPAHQMRRILFMPAHVLIHSALERQLLIQLGGRLRAARTHRGWTASQVADRAEISRTTLHAVESGAASPAIGTYLKVLGVLGLAGDLALVATGEGTTGERP
ncbi:MAG: XRE family transcriptional regulator [Pseudomonas sp.]|nr:MAG: XRE family transcriptional regulator [Pseudomonas sp.]